MTFPPQIAFDAAASCNFTVSNSAITLGTQLAGENTDVRNADSWTILTETDAIRLFWNGNIPTASLGYHLRVNGTLILNNVNPAQVKMIRVTNDASVTVIPGRTVLGVNNP